MLVCDDAKKYIKRLEIDHHNLQIRVRELEHNLVDWNRSQLSDRETISKLEKRIAWIECYGKTEKEADDLRDKVLSALEENEILKKRLKALSKETSDYIHGEGDNECLRKVLIEAEQLIKIEAW